MTEIGDYRSTGDLILYSFAQTRAGAVARSRGGHAGLTQRKEGMKGIDVDVVDQKARQGLMIGYVEYRCENLRISLPTIGTTA